ncbi:DUF1513 domain-containing protein [Rhizobium sp. L1K21]|uniref:DUF1513 domain-containing protein n=1 Tax=Rhizobium sp. L1K21 TaxID=2954933 RepID=UPI0020931112|nr:DUF1513 domain-containing protein [Rhizobium sp. L1K21]MCO6187325.1 DUF1513 domain-containing protein [Rhizobium sp. L1K21]
MRGRLIDRRSFIRASGAAFLAGLTPRSLMALERADAVYAAGFMDRDGNYGMALVSEQGTIIDRIDLPDRAHGLAASKSTGMVAAFARRPGTFVFVYDMNGRQAPVIITANEDRHFYGHGKFSPDGRLLYASENDFDNRRGVIGIYDATAGFERIGEFPTYGIGPHDLTVSDDGSVLIAANGGIETHPDFGRTKLNLDHMEPSLALIDAKTGALMEKHGLSPELSQLSIRHADTCADGRIWFACQYQGPRNDLPPLIGSLKRGEDLNLITLPEDVTEGLANYVGAIAVNRHDGLVAATSPKGSSYVILDADTGALVSQKRFDHASAVASASHGFAVSNENGLFLQTRSDVAWDQHAIRLKGKA